MRLLLIPLTVSLLSGCAALSSEAGGTTGGEPRVVAAFYPLQYAAERVTGAEVESLTAPGGEPHDLELGVGETALLTRADLLVVLSGFQPAVDASVAENATGEVLDAADEVSLDPFEEGEGHAEEGHAEEGHEEEGHEDEGHEDHGELDPHFWHDPLLMADLGDALADRLAELDPENAEEYTANAADLRDDLTTLDEEFTAGLATCEIDTVVTNHDAFGYLERYGLHLESIAGISPDAEPTPAALAQFQDLIDTEGVTTVFSETLVSPATAESLARDAGVTAEALDTVEGLTDETAGEDYLSLMRTNLAALEQSNRC